MADGWKEAFGEGKEVGPEVVGGNFEVVGGELAEGVGAEVAGEFGTAKGVEGEAFKGDFALHTISFDVGEGVEDGFAKQAEDVDFAEVAEEQGNGVAFVWPWRGCVKKCFG